MLETPEVPWGAAGCHGVLWGHQGGATRCRAAAERRCCRYVPEGLQCSCGPDWYTVGTKYKSEYYTWFLFIFCFLVPLSLIIFSYSQLLRALRAVSPRGTGGTGDMGGIGVRHTCG